MKISGNTFIITGGVGGIGSAVAADFITKGANVVLFDILPEEKGAAFAASLDTKKVLYIKTDITKSDETKAGVQKAVNVYGNLKGLIHCAGIAKKRAWTNDMADSIADFQLMLNVNTLGTFIVNSHVADAINKPYNHPNGAASAPFWTTDEERGVIVNFSSIAGHDLYARTLCYGPTKAAVTALTKAFSDFLGPSGIRVNAISPSIVKSAMTSDFAKYYDDDLLMHATFPRRAAEPVDIISTVTFLVENQFVNGVDLQVDGGWRLVTSKPPGGPDPRELAPGLE